MWFLDTMVTGQLCIGLFHNLALSAMFSPDEGVQRRLIGMVSVRSFRSVLHVVALQFLVPTRRLEG